MISIYSLLGCPPRKIRKAKIQEGGAQQENQRSGERKETRCWAGLKSLTYSWLSLSLHLSLSCRGVLSSSRLSFARPLGQPFSPSPSHKEKRAHRPRNGFDGGWVYVRSFQSPHSTHNFPSSFPDFPANSVEVGCQPPAVTSNPSEVRNASSLSTQAGSKS